MYSRCFLIKRKTLKFIICAVIHNDFYLLQKSLYFDEWFEFVITSHGENYLSRTILANSSSRAITLKSNFLSLLNVMKFSRHNS